MTALITNVKARARAHQAQMWAQWLRERPQAVGALLRQHREPERYIRLMIEGGATEAEIQEVMSDDR